MQPLNDVGSSQQLHLPSTSSVAFLSIPDVSAVQPCSADVSSALHSSRTSDDHGGDEGNDIIQIGGTIHEGDWCACVSVVETLCQSADFGLCVEYGATLLESTVPGSLSFTDALRVLRCLSTAFTKLSEMERAKSTLSLWRELLESGGGRSQLCRMEHLRWTLRLWRATAEVHGANGEREEAVQALVVAWRIEAYLYGPESRRCMNTYTHIADLLIQLVQDADAHTILMHVAERLGFDVERGATASADDDRRRSRANQPRAPPLQPRDARDLRLFAATRRLQSVVWERQRRFGEAERGLRESIALLQDYLSADDDAETAASSDRRSVGSRGTLRRRVCHELGLSYLRLCEVEVAGRDGELTQVSGTSLRHFERGLQLLHEVLPPMNHTLIRGRLRLAALYGASDATDAAAPESLFARSSGVALSTSMENASRESSSAAKKGGSRATRRANDALHSSTASSYYRRTMDAEQLRADEQQAARDCHNNKNSCCGLDHSTVPALAAVSTPPLVTARNIVVALLHELNQSEVRGGRHVDSLIDVYEALGDTERVMGNHRAAATAYHKAKSAANQLFAPDHERCALLQHKLAEELMATGHGDDAYHLLRELREWCELCPAGRRPPIPPYILHHSLGSALRLTERFDQATQHFMAALREPHIDFVTKTMVLGNMAAMQLTRGDIHGALHYNHQALAIRIAQLGEAHEDVAASHGNLAVLYREQGNAKQALFHSEKCLAVLDAVSTREEGVAADNWRRRQPKDDAPGEAEAGGRSTGTGKRADAGAHTVASHRPRPRDHALSRVAPPPPRAPTTKHAFYQDVSAVKAWCIRQLKTKQ